MGDYFNQTFSKCIAGLTAAAIEGRPVSPSTQENCAVAAREAKEMAESREAEKQQAAAHAATKKLRKLVPHFKPRTYEFFRKTKVVSPQKFRESVEKLLESSAIGGSFKELSSTQRQEFLKKFGAELLLKNDLLLQRLLQEHLQLYKK